jgi:hypothetical protein
MGPLEWASLNHWTMDTVQNNDFNSDILEPSSVTFRIYLALKLFLKHPVQYSN